MRNSEFEWKSKGMSTEFLVPRSLALFLYNKHWPGKPIRFESESELAIE